MSLKSNHSLFVTGFIVFVIAGIVYACVPFSPHSPLLEGDNAVLRAPIANFASEIKRVKSSIAADYKAVVPKKEDYYTSDKDYYKQTADYDVADLKDSLSKSDVEANKKKKIINEYSIARKAVFDYQIAKGDKKILKAPEIPYGLPREFEEYMKGAILYHSGKKDEARKCWEKLLELPGKERHYRSTWAAFMIGKVLVDEEPGEAIKWFQKVRELVKDGYADSIGLASASFGSEARILFRQKKYAESIELYVAQNATGDRTAYGSLIFVINKIKDDKKILAEVARNETARRAITAFIVSKGSPYDYDDLLEKVCPQWLETLETVGIEKADEADRAAWIAYQLGKFELSDRWLKIADKDSAITQWLIIKLLLRDGKIDEAVRRLSAIVKKLPLESEGDREWEDRFFGELYPDTWGPETSCISGRMRGELGVLYVSRKQYVEALDVFMKTSYWQDAAYIAEKVLTPNELIKYVDSEYPPDKAKKAEVENGFGLRYLLARRLTRIGRWKEARPYYPENIRPWLDEYIKAIRGGHDKKQTKEDRAKSFWRAACMARYRGMSLLGTEYAPDGYVWFGGFGETPEDEIRGKPSFAKLLKASEDELKRAKKHRPDPNKRFHYRYIAAEHAWSAAELMPDESEETARVLSIAGIWLNKRDPKASLRFYMSLIKRCSTTKLGIEAARSRAFPKIKIDMDELLKE